MSWRREGRDEAADEGRRREGRPAKDRAGRAPELIEMIKQVDLFYHFARAAM